MSLTLKIATATTIVLSKARSLFNGIVLQKVGTSFADTTVVTALQNVGKDGTARTRFVIKRPYTVTNNGVSVVRYMHVAIETTCPEDCPLTTAGEATWLAQSLAADAAFNDLVQNRVNSFA